MRFSTCWRTSSAAASATGRCSRRTEANGCHPERSEGSCDSPARSFASLRMTDSLLAWRSCGIGRFGDNHRLIRQIDLLHRRRELPAAFAPDAFEGPPENVAV